MGLSATERRAVHGGIVNGPGQTYNPAPLTRRALRGHHADAMARPTALTPDTAKRIIDAIRLGNYATVACQLAGIDDATFYRWMERGEDHDDGTPGEEPFREFRESVKRAEAEAEAMAVGTLVVASRNNASDALRFLERRYPKRWRPQYTTEVTGADGGPVAIEIARTLEGMSDADLAAVRRTLAGAVGGPVDGGGDPEGEG